MQLEALTKIYFRLALTSRIKFNGRFYTLIIPTLLAGFESKFLKPHYYLFITFATDFIRVYLISTCLLPVLTCETNGIVPTLASDNGNVGVNR